MSDSRFEGRWKLISHEFTTSDGRVFYPWGDDPVGEVIFDGNGYFSAQIMRRDRLMFSSDRPSDEEVRSAYGGYMAYFGRAEIIPEKNMLVNHVEGALNPAWVGGKQIRYYEFSGDRMTLRTDPIGKGNVTVTGVLVWERCG